MIDARNLLLALAACALLFGHGPAMAADPATVTLFGTTHAKLGPATLVEIDPATGGATSIGAIGFDRVSAIDFVGRTLYGIGERTSDSTQVLITIDLTTGDGTEVGPTEIEDASQNPDPVPGATYDPSRRKFYAYSKSGRVWEIDLGTGQATLVAELADGDLGGNGFAASDDGTLYHSRDDNLFTIDLDADDETDQGALVYPAAGDPDGLNALDVNRETGVLFGSLHDAGGSGRSLVTVNTTTRTVTDIGAVDTGLSAIAWYRPNAAPELDEATVGTARVAFRDDAVLWVTAFDEDGDTLTYDWDLGDGNVASTPTVVHKYAAPGDYVATVTVSDGTEQFVTTVDVKVNTPPVIESGPTSDIELAAVDEEVTFGVLGSDADGDVLEVRWDFGDGTTAVGSSQTHAFGRGGMKPIQVVVDDGFDPVEASLTQLVADPILEVKLAAKLNFKKESRDSLRFRCQLGLPVSFSPSGLTLDLDVGGVAASIPLDLKGKGKTELGKAKLKYTKKKGTWSLKLRLKKGSFAAAWADEGLANDDKKDNPVILRITVFVGEGRFAKLSEHLYTGKAGKRGIAK